MWQVSHQQSVHFQDTQPPVVQALQSMCFLPFTFLTDFTISNVTDLVHGIFNVSDACSTVTISLTGCTSNLDTHFSLVANTQGFNSDCIYYSTNDQLLLKGRLDWLFPGGRIFTISGVATDACGHTTPVSRNIWVPIDRNSLQYVPFSYNMDQCQLVRTACEANCPCEYRARQCEVFIDSNSLDFVSSSYDATSVTTAFNYIALFNGNSIPARFTIGIDLTKASLVNTAPSVPFHVGFEDDSIVSGTTFSVDPKLVVNNKYQVSFTLNGKYNLADGALSYLFFAINELDYSSPDTCSPISCVRGPVLQAQTPTSSAVSSFVYGNVFLVDIKNGQDRSAQISVREVAVGLYKSVNVVAMTLTDGTGAYLFNNLPVNLAIYSMGLIDQGALRFGAGYNRMGAQFMATANNAPQAISDNGTNNNLQVLLADDAIPQYLSPRIDNSFKSMAEATSFWQYNVGAYYQGSNSLKLPVVQIKSWINTVVAQYPMCQLEPSNVFVSAAQYSDFVGGAFAH